MCEVFDDCFYFDADFNDEATRYFLQCLGPGIPQTTLHSIDSQNYTMLEGNADIKEAYEDKVRIFYFKPTWFVWLKTLFNIVEERF